MDQLFKNKPITAQVPITNIENIPADKAEYHTNSPYRPNLHFGQMKLLLSELDFMNLADANDAVIVYIGACPFMHGSVLLEEYPNITMITVDPAELMIKFSDGKVHYNKEHMHKVCYVGKVSGDITFSSTKYSAKKSINHLQKNGSIIERTYEPIEQDIDEENGYATDGEFRVYHFSRLATVQFMAWLAQWIRRNFYGRTIYFWSDIRSSPDCKEDLLDIDHQAIFEIGVIRDNCLNYLLHRTLVPAMSMLKFRAPFIDADRMSAIKYHAKATFYPREIIQFQICAGLPLSVDYITEMCRSLNFTFIDGEVRTQAYAGAKSSETRMIVREKVPKLKVWNVQKYENKLYYYNAILRPFVKYANKHADHVRGICHCGDCARACHINYNAFNKFLIMMRYNMHEYGHGKYAYSWSWKKYLQMAKKYKDVQK